MDLPMFIQMLKNDHDFSHIYDSMIAAGNGTLHSIARFTPLNGVIAKGSIAALFHEDSEYRGGMMPINKAFVADKISFSVAPDFAMKCEWWVDNFNGVKAQDNTLLKLAIMENGGMSLNFPLVFPPMLSLKVKLRTLEDIASDNPVNIFCGFHGISLILST